MSRPSDRAGATVLAAVLLVAVTVLCGAVVGGLVLSTAAADPAVGPRAALSLSVDGERVRLAHRGGDALDVRSLALRVAVNGTPLVHQPPVPFFAARGFESGPTGPFNAAADPAWTAGETASFAVAGTNRPTLRPGSTVTVRVRVRTETGNRTLATLEARASGGGG